MPEDSGNRQDCCASGRRLNLMRPPCGSIRSPDRAAAIFQDVGEIVVQGGMLRIELQPLAENRLSLFSRPSVRNRQPALFNATVYRVERKCRVVGRHRKVVFPQFFVNVSKIVKCSCIVRAKDGCAMKVIDGFAVVPAPGCDAEIVCRLGVVPIALNCAAKKAGRLDKLPLSAEQAAEINCRCCGVRRQLHRSPQQRYRVVNPALFIQKRAEIAHRIDIIRADAAPVDKPTPQKADFRQAGGIPTLFTAAEKRMAMDRAISIDRAAEIVRCLQSHSQRKKVPRNFRRR